MNRNLAALAIAVTVALTGFSQAPDPVPLSAAPLAIATTSVSPNSQTVLARQITDDKDLATVLRMARDLVVTDLQAPAGSGYRQVWVRDFNTFLPLYLESGGDAAAARDALLRFVALQQGNGSIPDGYEIATGKTFASTVETDQETSLVQAFHVYLTETGDWSLLQADVHGKPVLTRLLDAMRFLAEHRTTAAHGLLWSGATVDWGDIEAGNRTGTVLNDESHPALGIYANAMYAIALQNIGSWPGVDQRAWATRRDALVADIRRWLWDGRKYRAHVYLEKGSPFPADFDESTVNVHGGTAVAALAGLLTDAEVSEQVALQDRDVAAAGADSIGLTVYPPYPGKAFIHGGAGMGEYQYQNGGDWDWFGARMVLVLVDRDPATAYRELRPMAERVVRSGDFYEWWDRKGAPQGSAHFKGAAGVMGMAIVRLQAWAAAHHS